jgi:DNA primase
MSDIDRLRRDVSLSGTALSFGVTLQKNGHEWEACCPLHADKTASFTIFTGKDGIERFHCFGCAKGGDVIDFVQEIKGVDKKEAIAILGGSKSAPNIAPAVVQARDPYGSCC